MSDSNKYTPEKLERDIKELKSELRTQSYYIYTLFFFAIAKLVMMMILMILSVRFRTIGPQPPLLIISS